MDDRPRTEYRCNGVYTPPASMVDAAYARRRLAVGCAVFLSWATLTALAVAVSLLLSHCA